MATTSWPWWPCPGPCWWWGCQVWYPPSIVSPESPFLAHLKRLTIKSRRKTRLLCAVHWKAPADSFSICLSAATNKQTDFNISLFFVSASNLSLLCCQVEQTRCLLEQTKQTDKVVIVLRSTGDNLDASLCSRAQSGHLMFICLLPSLFVDWEGKQTNKQTKF